MEKVLGLLHDLQIQRATLGNRGELDTAVPAIAFDKPLTESVQQWLGMQFNKLISQNLAHLIHCAGVGPVGVVHGCIVNICAGR